jgi:DNA repair protein RadD
VKEMWAGLFKSSSVLSVLPTGSGKTECMIALIQKSIEKKPDLKVMVLVQKVNLLEQTEKRFKKVFKSVGVYCGSLSRKELGESITVSTIQSVHDVKTDLNMIIIDEVHNLDQESGRYVSFFNLNNHEKMKLVGFTATPFRADGYIFGEDKLFKQITYKKEMRDLIADGYLVPPTMKAGFSQFQVQNLSIRGGEYAQDELDKMASDLATVTKQVEDALTRMIGRRSAVWACVSINHAEMVGQVLRSMGEHVSVVHSKSDNRKGLIGFYQDEVTRHLVFVSIFSEGFDDPKTDCVVLMRPTRSPVLYVQTVGRALRPLDGKENALILDYGQVIAELGPIDDVKIGKKRRKGEAITVEMKFCPNCHEYTKMASQYCPVCSHQFFERDPLKNLSLTAASGIALKEKSLEEIEISKVTLSIHHSKNGNICLRVNYHTTSFLDLPISEYFVWDNEWAYKRMVTRLGTLGIRVVALINDQVKEKVGRFPQSITIERDKYITIKKLNWRMENELV